MTELLSELCLVKPQDPPEQSTAHSRSQITNLITWTPCFPICGSVMAGKHPEVVPELMAYMISIIRAMLVRPARGTTKPTGTKQPAMEIACGHESTPPCSHSASLAKHSIDIYACVYCCPIIILIFACLNRIKKESNGIHFDQSDIDCSILIDPRESSSTVGSSNWIYLSSQTFAQFCLRNYPLASFSLVRILHVHHTSISLP